MSDKTPKIGEPTALLAISLAVVARFVADLADGWGAVALYLVSLGGLLMWASWAFQSAAAWLNRRRGRRG